MEKNTALRAENRKMQKMFHTRTRYEKMVVAFLFKCHYLIRNALVKEVFSHVKN